MPEIDNGPFSGLSQSGGEYLFGRRDCKPQSGSYAGWAGGGGVDGSSLACGANYPNDIYSVATYGPFDLTNAASSVREVPRLRVALRNPDERETQFKIIDPPTARLGPGETAHFKTSFDNADETATVKVSFVPR